MEDSFIKLYRGLLKWEWYQDSQMVHLFIHLLLNANFADGRFKGTPVLRGQLITGRKRLSVDTGITEMSIRTCLTKLKSTNEITTKVTNEYTLITIVKYEEYQCYDKKSTNKSTSKLSNDYPTTNQRLTTIEEEKERKEEKEQYKSHSDFTILPNNKKTASTDIINADTQQKENIEFAQILPWPTFDDFWNLYDKKVGDKSKLIKKFNAIPQSEKEAIMNHVPVYVLSTPDKKYRKDPQTYINNKSWNNEIINPFAKQQTNNSYATSKYRNMSTM